MEDRDVSLFVSVKYNTRQKLFGNLFKKQTPELREIICNQADTIELISMVTVNDDGESCFATHIDFMAYSQTKLCQRSLPLKEALLTRSNIIEDDIEQYLYSVNGVFTPLIVSPLPNGEHWVLLDEFSYIYTIENEKTTYTVPAKFVTDFASVPRFFWAVIPKTGKYTKAAVLHDFLYWQKDVSRKHADIVFLAAMKDCGVGFFTRKAMYYAVRVGGHLTYRRRMRALDGELVRRV